MKLQEIANLTQGVYLSRIETTKNDPNHVEINLLTLKEFNETLGLSYRMSIEKSSTVFLDHGKVPSTAITDTESLVLHTLTQKVARLPHKYAGLLLTTNFVKIQLPDSVDIDYFEWYFNEHPFIQKQILLGLQGSVISTISLAHLKEINLQLPDIQRQRLLGKVSKLSKHKEQLLKEKIHLQAQLTHQQLVNLSNIKSIN
ncbi:restriction endonuclease subunit S [Solibacillus sp. A46]|uniref:Restriction endonuclease subunit S n=1 Tax=Solibacillus faecavium TaxID=2762221 RepID=A0ABR8Y3E4_9BACL|nr:restriction endonuclease subunit S [Solibacillus faecavium]MBD8038725.1 restriction endonuclease subunit S [Solibacillus faecavium]